MSGNPSAKAFSAGATRVSSPRPTSARKSTTTSGPATWSAARNIWVKPLPLTEAIAASLSGMPSGNTSNVRTRPVMTSWYPSDANRSTTAVSWYSRENWAPLVRFIGS